MGNSAGWLGVSRFFFALATGCFWYIEPEYRFELWSETMYRKKNAPQVWSRGARIFFKI